MQESFVLAEKYNNPVVVVSDAMLAKLRESVVLPDYTDNEAAPEEKHNTLTGAKGRKRHLITTCGFGAVQWNQFNNDLQKKYAEIAANEKRYESYFMDEDPDIVVVAFGAYSRVCLSGVKMAREAGLKVGMIRPISLWPFPDNAFEGLDGKQFLVFHRIYECGDVLANLGVTINFCFIAKKE